MRPPTAAQRHLIMRVSAVLAADERALGAWLAGSFAAGTADAYSDVDVQVLVGDEHLGWFRDHLVEVVRTITPDAVLVDRLPGLPGVLAITPDWLHLDLVVHSRATVDAGRVARLRPLFDRSGQTWPAAAPRPEPTAYFPAEAVRLYFYLLGKLAVVLGRGEVVLAMNGAVVRRDSGLVPVLIAANGVLKHDGDKRLNAHLTDEQRVVLESLPPLAADRAAVIAFDRAVAAEMIPRGRALAARTGADWPADLEFATLRYLERELGVRFGPPTNGQIRGN